MDLIEFEAARCLDGYRLTSKEPFDAQIDSLSENFEVYRPDAFPALFQQFADVPHTAQGMLNFANNFGLIGGLGYIAPSDLKGESYPVRDILEQQNALREAIQFYEARDWPRIVECYNTGWGRGALNSRLRIGPFGKLSFIFIPTNLNQFLWLQFARYVSGDTKLLRCEKCSSPFLVGTGTGRRDTAKFCSNACKTAAFRNRHIGSIANA
jgi:hypothetical protein